MKQKLLNISNTIIFDEIETDGAWAIKNNKGEYYNFLFYQFFNNLNRNTIFLTKEKAEAIIAMLDLNDCKIVKLKFEEISDENINIKTIKEELNNYKPTVCERCGKEFCYAYYISAIDKKYICNDCHDKEHPKYLISCLSELEHENKYLKTLLNADKNIKLNSLKEFKKLKNENKQLRQKLQKLELQQFLQSHKPTEGFTS